MEIENSFKLREVELTADNKIVLNYGEKEIFLHPNMPSNIIEAYLRLSFEKSKDRNRLILSITDKCNIKCDFCCHPYMDSEFDDEDAKKIVEEACSFGKFDEISLTGGEPFLKYDLILELAAICKSYNILFGVITNGYWGKSNPQQKCKELVDNGLCRITFSWDPSHGKYISVDTIMSAIESSMEAGLKVNLTGSFLKHNDTHENYGLKLDKYKKYANFVQSTYNIAAVGRGKKIKNRYVEEIEKKRFICPAVNEGNDLTLYSNEALVMPCCSVFSGYDLPMIAIGNWKKERIEDLYDNLHSNGYYRIVKDFGFNFLYELIKDKSLDLYKELPDINRCNSSCELCSKIAVLNDFNKIKQMCDDKIDEIILEKVEKLKALI